MGKKSGKVIASANTKGGVGKSTISGNLAWAFADIKDILRKTVLVDADPQSSVTKWFDLGEDIPFDRLQLNTARVLQGQLSRLRDQYEIIIVDCPPIQSDVTAAAVAQADLGLIPVQPSPLDMLAYSELLPLLRQAQGFNSAVAIRFVINQLAHGTILGREVQESLADAGYPIIKTPIVDRQAYRKIVLKGSSVVTQTGEAKDEVISLAKDILDVLEG